MYLAAEDARALSLSTISASSGTKYASRTSTSRGAFVSSVNEPSR
jgi:hypothetical protein